MNKSILGASVILGVFVFTSPAEAVITFERTYGGTNQDVGNSVQETRDGGFIIAGSSGDYNDVNDEVYLIKTNAAGDTVWTKTYGDTNFDSGFSVQETRDGGYIIAGYNESNKYCWHSMGDVAPHSGNVYLIKTDAAGDTIWTTTFGGTEQDMGRSVQETRDGGYIIAGFTGSFGAELREDVFTELCNVYLIKIDAAGDTIWTTTYGGRNQDVGNSVQETRDGGFIIAGETYSFGAGYGDVYLIRTDAAGDTLWTKAYGGTEQDTGRSVQETQDGGFIISGDTHSFGSGLSDVYLIRTDATGDTLWTETYGGTDYDRGYSVQETQDGGFIIAGMTGNFGAGPLYDIYLIKTDAAGDTVWTQTYGGTEWDEGRSVQETRDGGYIITGFTESFNAVGRDVYLIKTDAQGNIGVEIE